jgi:anti-anti-sigma regulatory factor
LTGNRENFTLYPLKSTIINLQGTLSAELGSEFYLEAKNLLSEPYLILLDASGLDQLDEIGTSFLLKTFKQAQKTKSKLAITGLSQAFWGLWEKEGLSDSIPRFSSRSEAIQYLESFLPSQPGLEKVDSNTSHPSLVYCPHCDDLLRVVQFGNQTCPKCKGKFYIQPNFHISEYERLV